MDEKFLEFWGNLLLSAARGKRQADETSNFIQKNISDFSRMFTNLTQKNLSGVDDLFTDLMKKNLSGLEDLSSTFRRLYGLDHIPERSAEYTEMAKKATQDFQNAFKDYMAMMGVIPKEEHLTLIEKYEKLKERCTEQEETIKHLKMLMRQKGIERQHGDAIESFQNIIKDQNELFHKMMKDFGQYFDKKEESGTQKKTHPIFVEDDKAETINLKGEEKNDGTQ